ncbi:MAG: sensor histidine kinase [Chloroflexota bacterium]
MPLSPVILISFFYGLSFFSMGLLVMIEGGRASDLRLRRALRPLAAFGLVHAVHEWVDMYSGIAIQLGQTTPAYIQGVQLAILTFSFLSLAAFGSYLITTNPESWRLMLLIPLGLETAWAFGIFLLRSNSPAAELWNITDVWTRYSLAIPAAILASIGLVVQQREFRKSGLISFGRDSLWAAVAFAWYGIIGQAFTQTTSLFPSNIINQELFIRLFGFPVQLFRAGMAILASIFIIRFLRSFQVEFDRKLSSLQDARIKEAEQKEALRGELFKRVVSAQESERQRIARELHDETGQALTAIGMGLRGLSTTLKSKSEPGRAQEILHRLEGLTTHSLTELQRLIADLRPSHLDDLGLPAALRWYANVIQERSGLHTHVDIRGQENLVSPAAKTALFRIVQEALTNVVKHAVAENANIILTFESDGVGIKVLDDGQGFEPHINRPGQRISWGLKNMEERASLLGGKLTIKSQPGAGTSVVAFIPYSAMEAEALDEDTFVSGG